MVCLRTRPAITYVLLVVPAALCMQKAFIPWMNRRGFQAKFTVTTSSFPSRSMLCIMTVGYFLQ